MQENAVPEKKNTHSVIKLPGSFIITDIYIKMKHLATGTSSC